jgi:protein-tyrosine phosphatase
MRPKFEIASAYDCGIDGYSRIDQFSVMPEVRKTRVLFVCMGNICRSPTAEAVFRHAVAEAGLKDLIECDSAGTHGYHIGEPPDRRAQQAALRRGYDMSNLRGRKVGRQDFEQFDHVVAMDRHNLSLLEALSPAQHAHKLALYCDFHAEYAGREVPDPYYGGADGFEQVLDLIEAVSESLIARLRQPARE